MQLDRSPSCDGSTLRTHAMESGLTFRIGKTIRILLPRAWSALWFAATVSDATTFLYLSEKIKSTLRLAKRTRPVG